MGDERGDGTETVEMVEEIEKEREESEVE